ncbi:MAG: RNA polymerase sigma factor [Actinomycetota bacterium]
MPHELDQTYRRTFARLKGLFRARGCTPEEAADLAQEAAMRAYVHVRRWGVSGEGLDPLINRIARNLLIDRHRRFAPHLVSLDNAADVSDPTSDPTEEVIRRQQAGEVQTAVAELPSRHRTALEYSMRGMTPAEVGDRLGIGRNAADALLHRARRSLRDRLSHIEEGALGLVLWIRLRVRNAVAKTGIPGSFEAINATSASIGFAASAAVFAAINIFAPTPGFAGVGAAHLRPVHSISVSAPQAGSTGSFGGRNGGGSAGGSEFGFGNGLGGASFHNGGNSKGFHFHVSNPGQPQGPGIFDFAPDVVRQQNNNALVQKASDQVCYSQYASCDPAPGPKH